MLRATLDRELRALCDRVLMLGSKVEKAVANSVEILKRQDLEAAKELILADREINRARFKIEEQGLALIATQQPLAGDLRMVAAVLDIATELERIGDYAKGIAKITRLIGQQPLIKPLVDLPLMADKALEMLRDALNAFVHQDAESARRIPSRDDEIDALYNQISRELTSLILSNPRTMEQANYLLWAAHNLERTADRVTNICERIVFTVTGSMQELDTHFEKGHP